ncbi:hypothetical protein, partial [Ramlibacter sp.]|uniref:hypothetical protein n=1 Tax=Ramlibacter sp. TaxID=1917967 RepID=UPI002D66B823
VLSVLDKRIQVMAGVRQQQVVQESFSTVTGARTSQYDEAALTPTVGLVVKPNFRSLNVEAA